MITNLKCIVCGEYYHINRTDYRCEKCNGLLEVNHQGIEWQVYPTQGVWRYKEMIHPTLPDEFILSLGEGATSMYESDKLSRFTGVSNLHLKHEGRNPTGSFKDRGMTVAISEARRLGMSHAICASTGNTSSSAAAYTSFGNMGLTVIIPSGKITKSKLAQAVAYGANIETVEGTFDNAMSRVRDSLGKNDRPYPVNSINPWRLEGQKTIIYELIEELTTIDFIAVPSGNLGNISAFGKAIREMKELGVLYDIPKLVSVQAEGASPFYKMIAEGSETLVPEKNPETLASAIRIGNPVNWQKAKRALEYTKGIAVSVTDEQIYNAKRMIDLSGIGCEPASAASVAGIKKLREEGVIDKNDVVACVLTGHILKDTEIILEELSFNKGEEILPEID